MEPVFLHGPRHCFMTVTLISFLFVYLFGRFETLSPDLRPASMRIGLRSMSKHPSNWWTAAGLQIAPPLRQWSLPGDGIFVTVNITSSIVSAFFLFFFFFLFVCWIQRVEWLKWVPECLIFMMDSIPSGVVGKYDEFGPVFTRSMDNWIEWKWRKLVEMGWSIFNFHDRLIFRI